MYTTMTTSIHQPAHSRISLSRLTFPLQKQRRSAACTACPRNMSTEASYARHHSMKPPARTNVPHLAWDARRAAALWTRTVGLAGETRWLPVPHDSRPHSGFVFPILLCLPTSRCFSHRGSSSARVVSLDPTGGRASRLVRSSTSGWANQAPEAGGTCCPRVGNLRGPDRTTHL